MEGQWGGVLGTREPCPLGISGRRLPPPASLPPPRPADAPSPPQGLSKLLGDNAPGCMKEEKFSNYFGRKIAVDASMHIYSFLVSPAVAALGGARPPWRHRRGYREARNSSSTPPQGPRRSLKLSCCCVRGLLQVVVGRQGDQLLTSEAGDVTRWVLAFPRGGAGGWGGLWGGGGTARFVSALAHEHPHAQPPPPPPPSPLLHRTPHHTAPCSHLQGMFFRTARMLESGMKPV